MHVSDVKERHRVSRRERGQHGADELRQGRTTLDRHGLGALKARWCMQYWFGGNCLYAYHRSWGRAPERGGDAPDTVGYVRPVERAFRGEGETRAGSDSVLRESDATKTYDSTATVTEKLHTHASRRGEAVSSRRSQPVMHV